jgi:hypothetical protein
MIRRLAVVVVQPDGRETPVTTEEESMSKQHPQPIDEQLEAVENPAPIPATPEATAAALATLEPPKSVAHALSRLTHLVALVDSAADLFGHFTPGTAECLAETRVHLWLAHAGLAAKPADWIPPRKPTVRAYQRIAVGDFVKVGEKYHAKTPQLLRAERLAVVATDGDLVTVELHVAGVATRFCLERRFLELA